MSKFRKTLKKRVNPAKSNKMIIAVGIGSAILLVGLFLLVQTSSTPSNKAEAMDKALKYLKDSEGILLVKTYPEQNMAIIVYDSQEPEKDKKPIDFLLIARYAGIRLSNEMGNIDMKLVLAKDKESSPVHEFILNSGNVIKEIAK